MILSGPFVPKNHPNNFAIGVSKKPMVYTLIYPSKRQAEIGKDTLANGGDLATEMRRAESLSYQDA